MKALTLAMLIALFAAVPARADLTDDVATIRHEWERIMYRLPKAEQEAAFERLAQQSAEVKLRHANRAEAAIWHGIIESSYAGVKGGLGALGLVRDARKAFEEALALDPRALEGSAYTSLGSLYYQVPGWPIGFGDSTKARQLLLEGLAINPNGIDPNYFYGDFLYRSGDYVGAEKALRKALQAPPRPGRELADEGRRAEAQALLEKVRARRQ